MADETERQLVLDDQLPLCIIYLSDSTPYRNQRT